MFKRDQSAPEPNTHGTLHNPIDLTTLQSILVPPIARSASAPTPTQTPLQTTGFLSDRKRSYEILKKEFLCHIDMLGKFFGINLDKEMAAKLMQAIGAFQLMDEIRKITDRAADGTAVSNSIAGKNKMLLCTIAHNFYEIAELLNHANQNVLNMLRSYRSIRDNMYYRDNNVVTRNIVEKINQLGLPQFLRETFENYLEEISAIFSDVAVTRILRFVSFNLGLLIQANDQLYPEVFDASNLVRCFFNPATQLIKPEILQQWEENFNKDFSQATIQNNSIKP
jgi:hypothetical protein